MHVHIVVFVFFVVKWKSLGSGLADEGESITEHKNPSPNSLSPFLSASTRRKRGGDLSFDKFSSIYSFSFFWGSFPISLFFISKPFNFTNLHNFYKNTKRALFLFLVLWSLTRNTKSQQQRGVEKPNMDKELPVDVTGSSYSYSVKGKEQAKMKEAKELERKS